MKNILKDRCPICDSIEIEFHRNYQGIHPLYTGLQLSHCKSCDFVFVNPMPSEAELIEYNESYFNNAHGGFTNSNISNSFFSGIAKLRLSHLKSYLNKYKINVDSVLEIGPGLGLFASNWIGSKSNINYFAVETDSTCHSSLREKGVQVLEVTELESSNLIVDCVVMSHVLEHVSDAKQFLINTTSKLKSGGVLFIEVPCRDWEFKKQYEPHLLFFDKEPMRILLDKLGFENIQVSYHGQAINNMKSESFFGRKMKSIRSRLISFGIIKPFANKRKGMEAISNGLERAVLAPYEAHLESLTPAWWLRAVAVKK